jgi:hypothetical protein
MRHLIELLLCGTIGGYCLVRVAVVAPAAFAEVQRILALGIDRQRKIEEALDTD